MRERLVEFLKRIINQKIFQNFSYLFLGNIGMQVLNLISVMVITKIFKPDLFGIYSFMVIQSMLLAAIAGLGMQTILIRAAASDSDQLNRIFSIKVVSILIANVVLLVFYYFYNVFYGELTFIQVLLISLFSVVSGYNTSVESVFIGIQKMLPIAIANIINSIIWLLFVVLIFDNSISINLFFLIYIIIYSLKPIQFTANLFYKFKLRFEVSNYLKEFKFVFIQALPFWGLILVSLPANYLANNFLAYNSNIEQVGFFSLSQKFTSPITIVLTLMFTALFPNISVLWLKSKEDFQRIIYKSVPAFIFTGTLFVTLFLIIIDPVFKLFFSENYYSTLVILKFQIWYVFLYGLASLIGTILTAMNEDKLLFKMALLNTLIITPILWFGSKYGGIGLSIGYVLGCFIYLTLNWFIFAKKTKIPLKLNKVLIAPLAVFIIFNAYYLYNS